MGREDRYYNSRAVWVIVNHHNYDSLPSWLNAPLRLVIEEQFFCPIIDCSSEKPRQRENSIVTCRTFTIGLEELLHMSNSSSSIGNPYSTTKVVVANIVYPPSINK